MASAISLRALIKQTLLYALVLGTSAASTTAHICAWTSELLTKANSRIIYGLRFCATQNLPQRSRSLRLLSAGHTSTSQIGCNCSILGGACPATKPHVQGTDSVVLCLTCEYSFYKHSPDLSSHRHGCILC